MVPHPDDRTASVCDTDMPAAAYCGTCGAHLSAQRGDGRGGCASAHPRRHRASTCCGCPWRVRCSRTCLTARAHRFGWRWRCCSWRWSPSRCCAGKRRWSRSARSDFLSCFGLYMHETDIDDDLPIGSLVLTALLGVALGVGMGAGDRRTRRAEPTTSRSVTSNPTPLGVRGVAVPVGDRNPHAAPLLLWCGCCGRRHPRVVGRLRDRCAGRHRVHRRGDAHTAGAAIRHGPEGGYRPTDQRASCPGRHSGCRPRH